MSEPHLLVVDDEPFNLEIIAEYFDDQGYRLDTASQGEEAWTALNREGVRYDAIILDRMMPVLDGISLLLRIKSDPRFAHIPVIMQTAAGEPEQVREGLAAGAHYYLVKPYERESLLSIVRGALDDSAFRQQLQLRLARQNDAMRLLTSAEFQLRTLDEAETLATLVAQACPRPDCAVLGISELLVNAIEHGNLGITYDEKARLKRAGNWLDEVQRRLRLAENQVKYVSLRFIRNGSGVSIYIQDQGAGFDWPRYLDLDPARAFDPNGRGIALARMASFSSLRYEGSGNVVVATLNADE